MCRNTINNWKIVETPLFSLSEWGIRYRTIPSKFDMLIAELIAESFDSIVKYSSFGPISMKLLA